MKYHSSLVLALTPKGGPCQVGSLTGAVASQNVTEAPNGSLGADGNRACKSVKAQGSLTVRQTCRAGGKPGLSDPTRLSGKRVD